VHPQKSYEVLEMVSILKGFTVLELPYRILKIAGDMILHLHLPMI
jgi:hypothetical protein